MFAVDQEFETGVKLIRDAYGKKLAQKEAEVVHLRGENARKDAEIKGNQQQQQRPVRVNNQRTFKQISTTGKPAGEIRQANFGNVKISCEIASF